MEEWENSGWTPREANPQFSRTAERKGAMEWRLVEMVFLGKFFAMFADVESHGKAGPHRMRSPRPVNKVDGWPILGDLAKSMRKRKMAILCFLWDFFGWHWCSLWNRRCQRGGIGRCGCLLVKIKADSSEWIFDIGNKGSKVRRILSAGATRLMNFCHFPLLDDVGMSQKAFQEWMLERVANG